MSKKRKRIFLNSIKVFHSMSGQKIRIGNQVFDAPFQGGINKEEAKLTKEIIVQFNVAFGSPGIAQILVVTSQPTINIVSPGSLFIKNFGFRAEFANAGGTQLNNVTDKVLLSISNVSPNVLDAVSGSAIYFNSQQCSQVDGYQIALTASRQFTITAELQDSDVGLANFAAGDSIYFRGQLRLFY